MPDRFFTENAVAFNEHYSIRKGEHMMIVKSTSTGKLHTAYIVDRDGPWFCSICGQAFVRGDMYTRHTIFHPHTRKEAKIVQCALCYPVHEYTPAPAFDISRVDTAVWGNTGEMSPVQSGWERTKPTDISEVYTQRLAAAHPSALKRIKKVLVK